MTGDLQLQPQCGQFVAPGIVQLTRDSEALRVADRVGDDGLSGPQFPVRLGQGSRHFPFPAQRLRREHKQQLQRERLGDDLAQIRIQSLGKGADDHQRLKGRPAQRFGG